MWAQTWNNILDISTPYPGKEAVDVTPQMKKQVITEDHYPYMVSDTI
jgi:peptidyl-dipeptidase A